MAKFTSNSILTERYDLAVAFAIAAHRHQVRKDGKPYLMHLQSVAASIGEEGGTETEIIAGWLHDYPEDIASSVEEGVRDIAEQFGSDVAEIVRAVSEPHKGDWYERKLAYVEQIRLGPDSAVLVSLADKLHNAYSYLKGARQGTNDESQSPQTQQRTLDFYDRLLPIYQTRLPNSYLLGELEEAIISLRKIWSGSE